MKTWIKLSFVAVAIVGISIACQRGDKNDRKQSPAESEIAFQSLLNNVNDYCSEFVGEDKFHAVTKGRGRTPWWKVLGADAFGALLGAALGSGAGPVGSVAVGLYMAIGSSVIAATSDSGIVVSYNPDETIIGGNIIYIGDDIDVNDWFGYYHNDVISSMYDQYGIDYIGSLNEYQLLELIADVMDERGHDVSSIYTNFNLYYQEFMGLKSVIIDSDDYYTKALASYPEMATEIEVLEAYILSIKSITEPEFIDFTAGFREIIQNSPIPASSKEKLRRGISTALGSEVLWLDTTPVNERQPLN